MTVTATGFAALAALALVPGAANAQADSEAEVIALPPMTTPDSGTKGNETLAIAWQATQLINSDLAQTSELAPISPDRKDYYAFPEVTAPSFSKWRARGAKALLTGFVQSRSDGRYTIGCYVYDVTKGRELAREGFVIAREDLRRAAHKCSGLAYKAITGSPGMFDARIAFVSEAGAPDSKIRRIAIMDSDGFDRSFLTSGDSIVLTPRLSPKAAHLAYVSDQGGIPQIRIIDLSSGAQHPLIPGASMTFAPRYSPDGTKIVFSMMQGPSSNIYMVGAGGGVPQRLTSSPAIDTDPSFSPDGRKIVFESDRSGTQQLYVMNSDGSDQRRITFGTAAYATPQWSPDGKSIAFTWRWGGTRRIGLIAPDGTGEKILTGGSTDEAPSWAASSRELIFQRTEANGRPAIYRLSLDGSAPKKLTIPLDGSDPNWSGSMD